MIFDLAILIALYGLLPLLIGAALTGLVRVRGSRLAASYVSGYVLLLAVFYLAAVISTSDSDPYDALYHRWPIICIFLASASVIVFVLGLLLNRASKARELASDMHMDPPTKRTRILLITTICLILFALLLLAPGAHDETPELVRLTLQTKAFFSTDPATGAAYADTAAQPGYIHLFYTVGASLTGFEPTAMLHWALPIAMIPLYICAYCRIAWVLFPREEEGRRRFRFVVLIILFFLIMTTTSAHVGFAVLGNSWNGVTLAASCLLPLYFAQCLAIIRTATDTRSRKKDPRDSRDSYVSLIPRVLSLVVLAAAISLCVPTGRILAALLAAATVLTVIGLRVYDSRKGGAA